MLSEAAETSKFKSFGKARAQFVVMMMSDQRRPRLQLLYAPGLCTA